MLSAIAITLCVGIATDSVRSDDSKIVGGWFVDNIANVPFIVSIQVKQAGHNCGGSLITPLYVMSACHCLADVSENATDPPAVLYDREIFLFVAGASEFNRDMGYIQIREAKAFHVHPNCSRRLTIVNDFSVGEMKTPFEITERVKPFNLLSKDPDEFEKKFLSLVSKKDINCKVAGWGETRRGKELEPTASAKLKAVRMYLISEQECQKMYSFREKEFLQFPFKKYGQICTVSKMKNESDCLGDSGSPFLCGEYVVGVVSYGYECGTEMPSVYTELKEFIRWFMTEIYALRSDGYLNDRNSHRIPSSPPPSTLIKSRSHWIKAWLLGTLPAVLQTLWIHNTT